jgi:hypothetical protein
MDGGDVKCEALWCRLGFAGLGKSFCLSVRQRVVRYLGSMLMLETVFLLQICVFLVCWDSLPRTFAFP